MTTRGISEVLQHLRRAVLLREGAGMTDGQLLDCFIGRRDQAVLGALVRRHGPMVWGVCRRVLEEDHDAEDAFQATFLVLVRKAATVVPREMVGNWLYGVAYQTALKARATAARRKARERQVGEMPEAAAAAQDVWSDLQPLLDQELSRLPEKYRSAIVLCDLEGKTRKETARQLGLPEGTLSGHLTRGRALLAKRLARVGLATSGGALAVVLAQNTASACIPPGTLVSSTIKAGALFVSGKAAATGVVSAKAAGLADWVLKSMLIAKLKSTAAVLLAAGVLAAGAGTTGLIHKARTATQALVQPEPELASTTPAGAPHEAQMAVRESGKENEDIQKQAPVPADPPKGSLVLAPDSEPAEDPHKETAAAIKFEIVGLKVENPPPRKPAWRVGKGTLEWNGKEIPITIEFEPQEEKKPAVKPNH
jgi:RNA polymerase sigma factor (sigma-70 family)